MFYLLMGCVAIFSEEGLDKHVFVARNGEEGLDNHVFVAIFSEEGLDNHVLSPDSGRRDLTITFLSSGISNGWLLYDFLK